MSRLEVLEKIDIMYSLVNQANENLNEIEIKDIENWIDINNIIASSILVTGKELKGEYLNESHKRLMDKARKLYKELTYIINILEKI